MAKRHYMARRETNDMVTRLRAQPPSPVPARGAMKKKKEENQDVDMQMRGERSIGFTDVVAW